MGAIKNKLPSSWGDHLIILLLILFGLLALVAGALLVFYFSAGRAQPQEAPSGESLPDAALEEDGRIVVVLDPGHGGHDPGALDSTGKYHEDVINYEVANRVYALLAAHEGVLRVEMSRGEDEYLKPAERGQYAQEQGADLFVSLHLNSDESKGRGFECYPVVPGNRWHEESVAFARMLVEEVEPTGLPIRGGDGLYYAFYVGGARKVLVNAGEYNGRYEGEKSFGVLETAGCPAVLVEQWYISSAEDMRMFNKEDGYDTMALCVYHAICRYYDLRPLH